MRIPFALGLALIACGGDGASDPGSTETNDSAVVDDTQVLDETSVVEDTSVPETSSTETSSTETSVSETSVSETSVTDTSLDTVDDEVGPTCTTIATRTPAEDAIGVGVLAPIGLTLDRATDVEVTLYDGMSRRVVPTTTSVDGLVVSITPAAPLEHGLRHRLTVTGAGLCAPFELHFTTSLNHIVRENVLGKDGASIDCTTYTLDAQGRYTTRYGNTPGDDGDLCTDDDVPYSVWTYTYDGDDAIIVRHSGPGPDGRWLTNDDDIGDYSVRTQGPEGVARSVSYRPGSDGKALTDDDAPYQASVYTYDQADRLARSVFYETGPDAAIPDADDVVSYWIDELYGEGIVDEPFYDAPGDDTKWLTSDDHVGGVTQVATVDGIVDVRFMSPGDDGALGTDDDEVSYVWRSYHDARGLETEQYIYTDDGATPTTSSPCSNHYELSYDASANVVERRSFNAGDDARCGTPDDYVDYVETYDTAH